MFYPFELERYLEELLPERDPLLKEMEAVALEQTIPVVTPAVGNYLALLIRMSRACRILEIGTAIGYSTIWLAKAAETTGGLVTTIDMNRGRRETALEYFRRAGVSQVITSLVGDVRQVLPSLKEEYDFIFIDAAKGEYLEYLDLTYPLLAKGGILVADNVLFRGWVVPGSGYEEKYNRMVRHLREFLQKLSRSPELQTSVLPFGDGLAVSVKF